MRSKSTMRRGETESVKSGGWGGRSACRITVLAAVAIAGVSVRGDVIAAWSFEESLGLELREIPSDRGSVERVGHVDAGRIVAGKVGHALRIIAPKSDAALARASRSPSKSGPIVLGAGEWTVACWLWLDSGGTVEQTIFEMGAGVSGATELVMRFGVAPRENAIVLRGVASETGGWSGVLARRVEFASPDGPAGVAVLVREWTLASSMPLPRDAWFHLVVTHTAEGLLRLFLNEKLAASADGTSWIALPLSGENYITLGHDGRGERRLTGAIDELRVSPGGSEPSARGGEGRQ